MKYLIIEKDGIECPILFPEHISHEFVFDALDYWFEVAPNKPEKVIIKAAGFCNLDESNTVMCYGQSISLSKSSRAEDGEIISKQLKN